MQYRYPDGLGDPIKIIVVVKYGAYRGLFIMHDTTLQTCSLHNNNEKYLCKYGSLYTYFRTMARKTKNPYLHRLCHIILHRSRL